MITRSYGQCCEGMKVSKVDNIERKIAGSVQGQLRMFVGAYHQYNESGQ